MSSPSKGSSALGWLVSFIFGTIRFFIYLLIIVGVIGAGAGVGVVKTFSRQLPEVGYHTYKQSINTTVYDAHGKLMTEFYQAENRKEKVPFQRIPKHMQEAIIAIEDGRFYQHYGIDPIRIIAAMLTNIRRKRKASGASTITQQLARNAFLTAEKTYTRKIKEILLSFKIEKTFTKNEILELYLNEIYFGHGATGIASAANTYFGKQAEDLTLPECAILASLPKSPSRYDPYRHPKLAKTRQLLVLNMMMENGFITEEQARVAKETPIVLSSGRKHNRKTSYFIEYVRNELIEKFGEKKVYTEGLKVYTTFDPVMQKAGENAFMESEIFKTHPLETHPTLQGALLSVEPSTGHIKAMVGGRDFKQSEFNRAVMAVRQPGSSFKPFLYLAAIDSGITPSELFIDEPLEIVNKYTHKVWKPKNYGNRYIGPVILKEALTKSLNSIAVKLIQRLGPRKVINYARMLGIKSDIGPHLSVALGAVDITLLEMVTAYSTIANEGIRVEPRCITRVVDRTGSVIYKEKYQGERVVDENSVYMLIDMMKNVVTSGTGTRARLKRPCAGKTGTTNNYIDAWFCGFTPDLVTCVYVGHDDRQALGPKMAGGTVAAPLWKLYMEEALKDKPVTDFRRPKGIRTCSICRDSGLIPSRYCDRNMSVAFRRGSEPDEMCDSHMVTQTADNYFEMDGSIIIRPHVMENDSGSVIETDSQFEAPPQPVSELVDNSSLLKMPDSGIVEKKERTERTRFKGTGRSKFQNKHGNPFSR